MVPKSRDGDLDNFWRPRGALPDWVNAVVAFACLITVAIAVVGAQLLWVRASRHSALDSFWIRNSVAAGLAGWIALSFVLPWKLARMLRVAVLLPMAHLICMALGWELWCTLSPQLPVVTVVHRLPLPGLLAGGAALFALASGLIARRRRAGESVHALAMMALLALLLVGLWLPIASAIWCIGADPTAHWSGLGPALDHPAKLATFVLAPPLLVSLALTALALRWPAAARRYRRPILAAGAILLAGALATRIDPSFAAELVYANFIHALLALGILAITAVGLLGAVTWGQTRRARRVLASGTAGEVTLDGDDREPVACIEIASWLRGPVRVLRPFVVATATGHVLVPGGAQLIASLSPESTRLRTGESIEVVRRGDRLVLSGYVAPDARHPFRESSALVPGPAGVFVSRAGDEGYGAGNVALAMWRPCVAYLIILTAIAIPALVAAASG